MWPVQPDDFHPSVQIQSDDGEKNDWHPSMRVYRQPKEGDWESVISQVADEFTGWLEKFSG